MASAPPAEMDYQSQPPYPTTPAQPPYPAPAPAPAPAAQYPPPQQPPYLSTQAISGQSYPQQYPAGLHQPLQPGYRGQPVVQTYQVPGQNAYTQNTVTVVNPQGTTYAMAQGQIVATSPFMLAQQRRRRICVGVFLMVAFAIFIIIVMSIIF